VGNAGKAGSEGIERRRFNYMAAEVGRREIGDTIKANLRPQQKRLCPHKKLLPKRKTERAPPRLFPRAGATEPTNHCAPAARGDVTMDGPRSVHRTSPVAVLRRGPPLTASTGRPSPSDPVQSNLIHRAFLVGRRAPGGASFIHLLWLSSPVWPRLWLSLFSVV
jgi:hypothetical protein